MKWDNIYSGIQLQLLWPWHEVSTMYIVFFNSMQKNEDLAEETKFLSLAEQWLLCSEHDLGQISFSGFIYIKHTGQVFNFGWSFYSQIHSVGQPRCNKIIMVIKIERFNEFSDHCMFNLDYNLSISVVITIPLHLGYPWRLELLLPNCHK